MTHTPDYRDAIGVKISLQLADLLESGRVKQAEAAEICKFVLEGVDKSQTQVEMVAFLAQLQKKWPYFENILQYERGMTEQAESQIEAKKIAELLKNNQIDEALKVTKSK